MPIATGLALGLGLGMAGASAGASLAGASMQSGAADQAAQLQAQEQQNALNFQEQMWNTQQSEIQPWLTSGRNALTTLDTLLGLGPGASAPASGAASGTAPPHPGTPFLSSKTGPGSGSGSGTLPLSMLAAKSPTSPVGPLGISPSYTLSGTPANRIGPIAPMPTGPALPSGPVYGSPPKQTGPATDSSGTPALPAAGGGSSSTLPLGSLAPGSLLQPWTTQFTAPTSVTEANDPGYQFRLQQGIQALQNSAAASGGLLSGGTAKGLENWAQQDASNEYQNVYNRALGQYQQAYNIYEQNQANTYNRLANLAGLGQTAVGQLNSAGAAAANNTGNILLGGGAQIGQDIQNAGAATASGYVGAGNALSGGIGNVMQYGLLSNLLNAGGSGSLGSSMTQQFGG